jgi:magnesium-transporting ATPase (P-type)
MLPMHVNFET